MTEQKELQGGCDCESVAESLGSLVAFHEWLQSPLNDRKFRRKIRRGQKGRSHVMHDRAASSFVIIICIYKILLYFANCKVVVNDCRVSQRQIQE